MGRNQYLQARCIIKLRYRRCISSTGRNIGRGEQEEEEKKDEAGKGTGKVSIRFDMSYV